MIADNTITGVSMGLSVERSGNTLIQGNVLTRLQMDAMRVVSSQDTVIDRNVVDDLYGSTYDENHDDILQYWHASGTKIISNLTITNNYFNAGDAAYQGIFGGGGMYDTTPAEGLVIDNNLIVTATAHGISATNFKNAQITNNTVIANPDALFFSTAQSGGSTSGLQPRINLSQLTDVRVSGNVGVVVEANPERDELSGTIVIENNIGINYTDPTSPRYVDKMFVNAGTGGVKDLRDFQAIDGSAVDGVGSSLTDLDDFDPLSMRIGESATLSQVFELSVHAPQDGVSYVWTTDDGRTFAGSAVSICFPEKGPAEVTLSAIGADGAVETLTRSVTASSPLLFDFHPETGFPAGKANVKGGTYMMAGDPDLTLSADGTRMVLSVDPLDQFGVNRLQPAFRAMDAFSIQLEFRQDTPDVGGVLLSKRDALWAQATADGTLRVSLIGPDGVSKGVVSTPGLLSDTGWHTLTLSYDGQPDGTGLTVRLDDADIGVANVTGAIDMASWPIMTGKSWNNKPGIDGEIGGLRVLDVPTDRDAEVDDPLCRVPQEMLQGIQPPVAEPEAPEAPAVPSLLVGSGLAASLVGHVDVDTLDVDMLKGFDTALSADGAALVFDGTARTSFALNGLNDLSGSDAFTLALSIGIDDAGQAGRVLFAPGFMSLSVDASGMVSWRTTLHGEDGTEVAQRGLLGADASARLADGGMHRLVLSYAEDAGGMSIWLDGELVRQHEMSGTVGGFNAMLGDAWKATFSGQVADVAVFHDAADAAGITEDFAAFAGGAGMQDPDLATIDVAFDESTVFGMQDVDDDSAHLVQAIEQSTDDGAPQTDEADADDAPLADTYVEPEEIAAYEDRESIL